MIVPIMAISNLVLTQQIYSEEANGAHAHYREPVPLTEHFSGFLGETEHFSGKNGALRWSILVGKQKHNVQKPTDRSLAESRSLKRLDRNPKPRVKSLDT